MSLLFPSMLMITLGYPYFYTLFKKTVYLIDPEFLNICKTLIIGEIINKENSMGSFVVGTGNCSESFLTSCIPYLQFYYAFVDVQGSLLLFEVLKSKIDADCSKIALLK